MLQENRWRRMNKRTKASSRTAALWMFLQDLGPTAPALAMTPAHSQKWGPMTLEAIPLAGPSPKGPHHNSILKSAHSMKESQGIARILQENCLLH